MRRQSIVGYLQSFEFSSVAESVRVESLPEAFHCWCIVSYIGSPRLIVVEVERFFVIMLLFAHFGGFGVVTVCWRCRIIRQASCAIPMYRYERVGSSLYCFKPAIINLGR